MTTSYNVVDVSPISRSSDLAVSTSAHGSVCVSVDGSHTAVLEPSGTAFVVLDASQERPIAAFSLQACAVHPNAEKFLPDLVWTAGGSYLCALTTHGQLFVLTGVGDLVFHDPTPLATAQAGAVAVGVVALSDTALLLLSAFADTFIMQLGADLGFTVTPFSFLGGRHRVARALAYDRGMKLLVVVGDGAEPPSQASQAAHVPAQGEESSEQQGVTQPERVLSLGPSISVWTFADRRPELISYRAANFARPMQLASERSHWRIRLSPTAAFVAVCTPARAWYVLMAGSDPQELDLPAPAPAPNGKTPPAGTIAAPDSLVSLAWISPTEAVGMWGSRACAMIDFTYAAAAGSVEVAPMSNVELAPGAALAAAWVEMPAVSTEDDGGDAVERQLWRLLALRPEWEDAASVPGYDDYTASAEQLSDRKGKLIANKFGVTARIVGWRLCELQPASPEQVLLSKIPQGVHLTPDALADALGFASREGVDTAKVWQAAWATCPKTEEDVNALLTHAPDSDADATWLAEAALASCCVGARAQRTLLQGALRHGALRRVAEASAGGGGSDDDRPCALRARVLFSLDQLETFVAVHSDQVAMSSFMAFAVAGLAASGVSFASAGNVRALTLLLRRHPRALAPRLFSVLSALPESVPPDRYVPLLLELRQVRDQGANAALTLRDADPSEQPAALSTRYVELGDESEHTEHLLASTTGSDRLASVAPAAVDEWVVHRALAVDDATGLLDNALYLLKSYMAGIQQPSAASESLSDVCNAAHMLHCVLKRPGVVSSRAIEVAADMDLRSFMEETAAARVGFVMHAALDDALKADDPERAAEVLRIVAAPALSVLQQRDDAVRTVLALEFTDSPGWVEGALRADVAAGCVLFSNVTKLALAVLVLLEGLEPPIAGGQKYDSTDLLRLLDIVRGGFRTAPPVNGVAMPAEVKERWLGKLRCVEDAVRAARIMSKYGLFIPPFTLTRCDAAAASGLLRSMLTTAAAAAAPSGRDADVEEAFAHLWTHTCDVHNFAFSRLLPLSAALREFVRAALMAQHWTIAERYLKGVRGVSLPPAAADATLIDAAYHMFTSASAQGWIDLNDPAFIACLKCLSLGSDTSASVAAVLDGVQALRAMVALGAHPEPDAPFVRSIFRCGSTSGELVSSPRAASSDARDEMLDAAIANVTTRGAAALAADAPTQLKELVMLLYPARTAAGGGVASVSEASARVSESDAGGFAAMRAQTRAASALVELGTPDALSTAAELVSTLAAADHAPAWGTAARLVQAGAAGTHTAAFAAFALRHCDEDSLPLLLAATPKHALERRGSDAGASSSSRSSRWKASDPLGPVLAEVQRAMRVEGEHRAEALQTAFLECSRAVDGAHMGNSPPTLGAASQAVLVGVELLRSCSPDQFEHFVDEVMTSVAADPSKPAHAERVLRLAHAAVAMHLLTSTAHSDPGTQATASLNGMFEPTDVLATRAQRAAEAAARVLENAGDAERAAAIERTIDLLRKLEGALQEADRVRMLHEALPEMDLAPLLEDDRSGAVFELASSAGRAAVSESDGSNADELAANTFSLASVYGADPWRCRLAMISAALSHAKTAAAADPILTDHGPPLLERPAHLIWFLIARLLPAFSPRQIAQWTQLLSLLSQALQRVLNGGASAGSAALGNAASSLQALLAFIEAAAKARGADDPGVAACLNTLATEGLLETLDPVWSELECPTDQIDSRDGLPAHDRDAAASAVFCAVQADTFPVLERLLSRWPEAPETSFASDESASGLCGLSPQTLHIMAAVKALTGELRLPEHNAMPFVTARLSALTDDLALTQVLEFAAGAAPSPLLSGITNDSTGAHRSAIELHPAAELRLLGVNDAAVNASQLLRERRRMLHIYRVIAGHLHDQPGAADVNESTVWSADDLDASSAAALRLASDAAAHSDPDEVIGFVSLAVLDHGAHCADIAACTSDLVVALGEENVSDAHGAVVRAFKSRICSLLSQLTKVLSTDDAVGPIADIEHVLEALSGPRAVKVPLVSVLRREVFSALLDFQNSLDARALQMPAIARLMDMQAELSSPLRWGAEFAPVEDSAALLLPATRAALAPAEAALAAARTPQLDDLRDTDAAARLFSELVHAAGDDVAALAALHDMLARVWRFGHIFADAGDGATNGASAVDLVPLHASASELADAYRASGNTAAAFRLVSSRYNGARLLSAAEVEALQASLLEASGGAVTSYTAGLLSGDSTCVDAACNALTKDDVMNSVSAASASCSPEVTAFLFHGISQLPEDGLARLLRAQKGLAWLHSAAASMPPLPADELRSACDVNAQVLLALPCLVARVCSSGKWFIAAELLSEHLSWHPGLRQPDALHAVLDRFLRRCHDFASNWQGSESNRAADGCADIVSEDSLLGNLVRWCSRATEVTNAAAQGRF